MVFVFLWLTSHSIVISRFIHVAVNGIILLFFMTEYYSIVYMYHIFFIYSSASEHWSWFHVLVIVSSAAMNFVVHVCFQIRVLVFSTCMLRSRISGPYGNWKWKVKVLISHSCWTLCDPMDCRLPGSVHEIFQTRILEWVDISFSRGSSWPRGQTWVFCIGRQILYHLSHQGSP